MVIKNWNEVNGEEKSTSFLLVSVSPSVLATYGASLIQYTKTAAVSISYEIIMDNTIDSPEYPFLCSRDNMGVLVDGFLSSIIFKRISFSNCSFYRRIFDSILLDALLRGPSDILFRICIGPIFQSWPNILLDHQSFI